MGHYTSGLCCSGAENECLCDALFYRRAPGCCCRVFLLAMAPLPQHLPRLHGSIGASGGVRSGKPVDDSSAPGVDCSIWARVCDPTILEVGRRRSDGKPFALFPDSRLYLEAAYYAKSEDCIFLLGSDATQKANQLNLLRLAQYYPLQFWTMDDLKRHASQTAFIAPRPDTLDALRLAGFQISVRFTKPLSVVYLQR